MGVIFEYSGHGEGDIPYWHWTNPFIEFMTKTAEPKFEEIVYELCLWLDTQDASFEDRKASLDELTEALRSVTMNIELDWNDASKMENGKIAHGIVPFHYREGRNNEPSK